MRSFVPRNGQKKSSDGGRFKPRSSSQSSSNSSSHSTQRSSHSAHNNHQSSNRQGSRQGSYGRGFGRSDDRSDEFEAGREEADPSGERLAKSPLPNTIVLGGRFMQILTKNLTPGLTFFEQEKLVALDDGEYREIDPRHSKLGAAIAKGCQQFGIKNGSVVLYLGASHGYTPSFVSDMVGEQGLVLCVDVAPRVVRDLVFVCEKRSNMMPILENASVPSALAKRICAVDVVFQDIAQKDQVDIFLRNVDAFLQPGGFGMLAVKARSIDVLRNPHDLFREIKRRLDTTPGVTIVDYRELDPFEKDHAFFVIKKKIEE